MKGADPQGPSIVRALTGRRPTVKARKEVPWQASGLRMPATAAPATSSTTGPGRHASWVLQRQSKRNASATFEAPPWRGAHTSTYTTRPVCRWRCPPPRAGHPHFQSLDLRQPTESATASICCPHRSMDLRDVKPSTIQQLPGSRTLLRLASTSSSPRSRPSSQLGGRRTDHQGLRGSGVRTPVATVACYDMHSILPPLRMVHRRDASFTTDPKGERSWRRRTSRSRETMRTCLTDC